MEILQKRIKRGANSTLSELFVNGGHRGFIVEDKDRGLSSDMPLAELLAIKVHSETAIPTGRYRIGLRHSPTFKRRLPWLLNVPGFQYIYCHPGNWIKDTLGCLLPGLSWEIEHGEYCVWESKKCFNPLYGEICAALDKGEDVWWTVDRAYEDTPRRLLV